MPDEEIKSPLPPRRFSTVIGEETKPSEPPATVTAETIKSQPAPVKKKSKLPLFW